MCRTFTFILVLKIIYWMCIFQAWCATGNCFSLQKEHDVAIRFFQRAMQVDPNFPYAYTLLGHEYVLIEELDKAMAAFRNAIRIDPRHYNAWLVFRSIHSIFYFIYKMDLDQSPPCSFLFMQILLLQIKSSGMRPKKYNIFRLHALADVTYPLG